MSLLDPECPAIAKAFLRRTPRRPPEARGGGKDPVFRRAGSSFDLKCIREYCPSDDPRRIDWKLLGRCGRPYVKEFLEEDRDGVCVLVDRSASIGSFGAEEAARVAASIAWLLGAIGLPTSLWAFSDRPVRRLERPRGGGSAAPVLSFFSGLGISGRTDISACLAAARASSRARRAVLVSDFLDPRFDPRASPFARSFYVRLRGDFEALAAGLSELRVVDPESGRSLLLPWDALARESYRARDRELSAALGEAARRGSWSGTVESGADRASLYWELLEAIYA
ncbi:MAG TPA: DUF58 domain-containing protein [Spirochaetales bacterium]|nr:DUF58 domain-containing protein [Spirochaetales bacterium]HRY53591.1 DUF58 domain-containing protein [Spirochaetia bacterium]